LKNSVDPSQPPRHTVAARFHFTAINTLIAARILWIVFVFAESWKSIISSAVLSRKKSDARW